MSLSTVYEEQRDDAENRYIEYWVAKITEMFNTGNLLDHSEVQAMLPEVFTWGTQLLIKIKERVLGKDRDIVFDGDMKNLDTVTELSADLESKLDALRIQHERLEDSKIQCNDLKAKRK